MKISFIADPHLRGKDLNNADKQLSAFTSICKEKGVKKIIYAGDIFDNPSIFDKFSSTGAIAEIAHKNIANQIEFAEIFMIPGNHDKAGIGTADALHIFDSTPSLKIIRNPEIIPLSKEENLDGLFIPWEWNPNKNAEEIISDLLNKYESQKFNNRKLILIAHLQVIGAKISNNLCCEAKPGNWQLSRTFLEEISEKLSYIALGDFHKNQELIKNKGGYIGALRQLNFGEEGNPQGFIIFDSDSLKAEYIEINESPKYISISIGDSKIDYNQIPDSKEYNIRLQFENIAPEPSEIKNLESKGIEIQKIIPKIERLKRAEVPEGIIKNPKNLIRLWGENQSPPFSYEDISEMIYIYDEIFSDKNLKEKEKEKENLL